MLGCTGENFRVPGWLCIYLLAKVGGQKASAQIPIAHRVDIGHGIGIRIDSRCKLHVSS